MAETASDRKKKKREKKKEKKFDVSLYINGIAYEHGVICGFCTTAPAVWHCPFCPDFFCASCDTVNHSVKKRKDHVRKMLSKLTKDDAAKLITLAVRYHGHLRTLQDMCRKVFRRYFDRNSLNHYYYNPVYHTVSWRKPYCLRKLELTPFITKPEAAARMQGLYRMYKARATTVAKLRLLYRKIFDRRKGKFYYAFMGKSVIIPKQSWKKPLFFGKRGYFKDIEPIYTSDVAALIIQRKWRALLVRRFFYALVRSSFEQQWDAVHGRYTYYHRSTETMWEHKPLLLGNQPWDPNYVPDWTVERVKLFFRRIGLKQYLGSVVSYDVDGRALCLLDKEDFDNMEIFNKVHIRKIRVELDKVYPNKDRLHKSDAHEFRRERIKRLKASAIAAVIIQKYFRRFAAMKELRLTRAILKTQSHLREAEAALLLMGKWWTERDDIPSKALVIPDGDSRSTAHNEVMRALKFPPIKNFGQRQDHLTCNGWGKRDPTGAWLPLLAASKKDFAGDAHPTRAFSKYLSDTGYDYRRLNRFKGLQRIKLEDTLPKHVIKAKAHKAKVLKSDDMSLAASNVVSVFSYHSGNVTQVTELDPNLDVLL